jgi:beta-mannosidase
MNRKEKIFTLNGSWFYLPDADKSYSYKDVKLFYKENELSKMKIPSNWYLSDLGDYSGSVWFVKEFRIEGVNDELCVLIFKGVDYLTEVYLNDQFVGKHEGYFQRFFFEINGKIQEGDNLLIIKVTSDKEETEFTWPHRKKLIKGIFNHHDCRPGGWNLLYGQDRNTGGIWNDVLIFFDSKIYISNFKVLSKIFPDKNSALVNFELEYLLNQNLRSNVRFKAEIKFRGEKVWQSEFVVQKNSETKIILIAQLENPQRWFPYEIGEPNLYEFLILSDQEIIFNSTFGLREIELKENVFLINGKRLFLRGTNIIPEQLLSTLTTEKIKFIVDSLKEANINVVRIHAHVNRQELYDFFDREGFLIWQDFALQWTYDESKEFIQNAVRQIKDMVKQSHHHPSIVFWCCHNEPGKQIETLDEFLYYAVLTEDSTRIVQKASNYEEHCYEGWYWGKKENYIATPMGPLVTEFGAQALPEKISLLKFIPQDLIDKPEHEKWNYHNFQFEQTFHIAGIERGRSLDEFIENSQTYQAELLKEAIHHYRRKKFNGISGIIQFMFIDCWESITWSVIDYFGKKKKGFFALKNAFNPLLLSVNLRQNIYSNLSKKFNLEFWIINDYHRAFQNFLVKFYLNEKEIYEITLERIDPDSIRHFSFEDLDIKIPQKLEPGFQELKIELRSDKMELISFDKFDLEYRNV